MKEKKKINNDKKIDEKKEVDEKKVEEKKVEEKKPIKPKKPKAKSLWEDFKKFISRGNVIDMAVGVIIGAAFKAIINAVVSIFMNICTWGIGGVENLKTYLPAIKDDQKGVYNGVTYGQFLSKEKYDGIEKGAQVLYKWDAANERYYTIKTAIIDWGGLIDAFINFIIIAITLFLILKIFQYLQKKRQEFKNNALEQYYLAHPDKRPPEEKKEAPKPTELDLLTEIRDLMADKEPKKEEDSK